LNWTLNATSVGIYKIDVNFTSDYDSSNVPDNDTVDAIVNIVSVVGDTCDCSSLQTGTIIDCSENCDISVCDVGNKDVVFTSSGTITTSGDVTNIANTYLSNQCILIIGEGYIWG